MPFFFFFFLGGGGGGGSSIKFQGHTGWKIDDLNPIWVRLLGSSQLSNPSDLPSYIETGPKLLGTRYITSCCLASILNFKVGKISQDLAVHCEECVISLVTSSILQILWYQRDSKRVLFYVINIAPADHMEPLMLGYLWPQWWPSMGCVQLRTWIR